MAPNSTPDLAGTAGTDGCALAQRPRNRSFRHSRDTLVSHRPDFETPVGRASRGIPASVSAGPRVLPICSQVLDIRCRALTAFHLRGPRRERPAGCAVRRGSGQWPRRWKPRRASHRADQGHSRSFREQSQAHSRPTKPRPLRNIVATGHTRCEQQPKEVGTQVKQAEPGFGFTGRTVPLCAELSAYRRIQPGW